MDALWVRDLGVDSTDLWEMFHGKKHITIAMGAFKWDIYVMVKYIYTLLLINEC